MSFNPPGCDVSIYKVRALRGGCDVITRLQRPKVASHRLYGAVPLAPSSRLLGGNWTLPH